MKGHEGECIVCSPPVVKNDVSSFPCPSHGHIHYHGEKGWGPPLVPQQTEDGNVFKAYIDNKESTVKHSSEPSEQSNQQLPPQLNVPKHTGELNQQPPSEPSESNNTGQSNQHSSSEPSVPNNTGPSSIVTESAIDDLAFPIQSTTSLVEWTEVTVGDRSLIAIPLRNKSYTQSETISYHMKGQYFRLHITDQISTNMMEVQMPPREIVRLNISFEPRSPGHFTGVMYIVRQSSMDQMRLINFKGFAKCPPPNTGPAAVRRIS